MIKHITLANGINILLNYEKNYNSISAYGYYPFGVATEDTSEIGITHFLEHLLSYNQKYESNIIQRMESIGINYEAVTFRDMVTFGIQAIPESFKEGFQLLIKILLEADFSKKDFDIEKKIIWEEINYYNSDAEYSIWNKVSGKVWGQDHPLGRPVEGLIETIQNLSYEDLKKRYETYYHTNNLTLVITGPFDKKWLYDFFALMEIKYPTINRSTSSPIIFQEEMRNSRGRIAKTRSNQGHHWVGFGLPISENYINRTKLDLMNLLIVESENSLLQREVINKRGMLYQLSSNSNTSRFGGEYALAFYSAENQAEKTMNQITTTLKNYNKITEKQVNSAKVEYLSKTLFYTESSRSLCRFTGRSFLVHNQLFSSNALREELESLSYEDIMLFMSEVLNEANIESDFM